MGAFMAGLGPGQPAIVVFRQKAHYRHGLGQPGAQDKSRLSEITLFEMIMRCLKNIYTLLTNRHHGEAPHARPEHRLHRQPSR